MPDETNGKGQQPQPQPAGEPADTATPAFGEQTQAGTPLNAPAPAAAPPRPPRVEIGEDVFKDIINRADERSPSPEPSPDPAQPPKAPGTDLWTEYGDRAAERSFGRPEPSQAQPAGQGADSLKISETYTRPDADSESVLQWADNEAIVGGSDMGITDEARTRRREEAAQQQAPPETGPGMSVLGWAEHRLAPDGVHGGDLQSAEQQAPHETGQAGPPRIDIRITGAPPVTSRPEPIQPKVGQTQSPTEPPGPNDPAIVHPPHAPAGVVGTPVQDRNDPSNVHPAATPDPVSAAQQSADAAAQQLVGQAKADGKLPDWAGTHAPRLTRDALRQQFARTHDIAGAAEQLCREGFIVYDQATPQDLSNIAVESGLPNTPDVQRAAQSEMGVSFYGTALRGDILYSTRMNCFEFVHLAGLISSDPGATPGFSNDTTLVLDPDSIRIWDGFSRIPRGKVIIGAVDGRLKRWWVEGEGKNGEYHFGISLGNGMVVSNHDAGPQIERFDDVFSVKRFGYSRVVFGDYKAPPAKPPSLESTTQTIRKIGSPLTSKKLRLRMASTSAGIVASVIAIVLALLLLAGLASGSGGSPANANSGSSSSGPVNPPVVILQEQSRAATQPQTQAQPQQPAPQQPPAQQQAPVQQQAPSQQQPSTQQQAPAPAAPAAPQPIASYKATGAATNTAANGQAASGSITLDFVRRSDGKYDVASSFGEKGIYDPATGTIALSLNVVPPASGWDSELREASWRLSNDGRSITGTAKRTLKKGATTRTDSFQTVISLSQAVPQQMRP